jgi:hypothetical protein
MAPSPRGDPAHPDRPTLTSTAWAIDGIFEARIEMAPSPGGPAQATAGLFVSRSSAAQAWKPSRQLG